MLHVVQYLDIYDKDVMIDANRKNIELEVHLAIDVMMALQMAPEKLGYLDSKTIGSLIGNKAVEFDVDDIMREVQKQGYFHSNHVGTMERLAENWTIYWGEYNKNMSPGLLLKYFGNPNEED